MQEPEVVNEHDPSATTTHADRRRPGRVEYRSASLIALLRPPLHPRDDAMDAVRETDDDQERKLPVGVAYALILFLSLLLWALIFIALHFIPE